MTAAALPTRPTVRVGGDPGRAVPTWVLAVTTSAAWEEVVVCRDGVVVHSQRHVVARGGTRRLLGLLDQALALVAGAPLLAVDVGPGSFTGVRMGLAVARALAWQERWPVVGVRSLDAMRWQERDRCAPDAPSLTLLPARAGYWYADLQDPSAAVATLARGPASGGVGEWTTERIAHWLAAQPQANVIAPLASAAPLGLGAHITCDGPRASAIAALAATAWSSGAAAGDWADATPCYVGVSAAERGGALAPDLPLPVVAP